MENEIIKTDLTFTILTGGKNKLDIAGCDAIIIDGETYWLLPAKITKTGILKLMDENRLSTATIFEKEILLLTPLVEGVDFFWLIDGERKTKIVFSEILYLMATDKFVTLFMRDKEQHVTAITLDTYMTMLPAKDFYRIHGSHIVNEIYILIEKYDGRGGFVIMMGDKTLDISFNNKTAFKSRIKAA